MSEWINHVKQYAKAHNLKYSDALKDPGCKKSYSQIHHNNKEGGMLPWCCSNTTTVRPQDTRDMQRRNAHTITRPELNELRDMIQYGDDMYALVPWSDNLSSESSHSRPSHNSSSRSRHDSRSMSRENARSLSREDARSLSREDVRSRSRSDSSSIPLGDSRSDSFASSSNTDHSSSHEPELTVIRERIIGRGREMYKDGYYPMPRPPISHLYKGGLRYRGGIHSLSDVHRTER